MLSIPADTGATVCTPGKGRCTREAQAVYTPLPRCLRTESISGSDLYVRRQRNEGASPTSSSKHSSPRVELVHHLSQAIHRHWVTLPKTTCVSLSKESLDAFVQQTSPCPSESLLLPSVRLLLESRLLEVQGGSESDLVEGTAGLILGPWCFSVRES